MREREREREEIAVVLFRKNNMPHLFYGSRGNTGGRKMHCELRKKDSLHAWRAAVSSLWFSALFLVFLGRNAIIVSEN